MINDEIIKVIKEKNKENRRYRKRGAHIYFPECTAEINTQYAIQMHVQLYMCRGPHRSLPLKYSSTPPLKLICLQMVKKHDNEYHQNICAH